jgi:hypothetical protein
VRTLTTLSKPAPPALDKEHRVAKDTDDGPLADSSSDQAKEKRRSYLPLMALAVEQLALRPYGLVFSSSYTVDEGLLARADQLHVSYISVLVRCAWNLYLGYLSGSGLDRGAKSWLARVGLHYLWLRDTHPRLTAWTFTWLTPPPLHGIDKMFAFTIQSDRAQTLHVGCYQVGKKLRHEFLPGCSRSTKEGIATGEKSYWTSSSCPCDCRLFEGELTCGDSVEVLR